MHPVSFERLEVLLLLLDDTFQVPNNLFQSALSLFLLLRPALRHQDLAILDPPSLSALSSIKAFACFALTGRPSM